MANTTRFHVMKSSWYEDRLLPGPYENNEERQYQSEEVERWTVMIDDCPIKHFYYKDDADNFLYKNLTIPGINSTIREEEKHLKATLRDIQKQLKSLPDKKKKAVLARQALLERKK